MTGPTGEPAPAITMATPVAAPGGRALPFLRRWGISLASLASGTLTLVVFRRGLPHVSWIVGYLIVLWLLFTLTSQLRRRLLSQAGPRVVAAADYTVQTLYHGLLLFVLPGYLASTTFDGPTAPFFLVLAAATLLTTIDPWYRILVHPRPWLARGLCALALFAGWNVALPLVGMPPAPARLLAALLAGLAVTPGRGGEPDPLGLRSARRAALTGLAALAAAWLFPGAIPPAPLHLVSPVMARDLLEREPVGRVDRITRAELRAGRGLYAFTPVAGPRGLTQHVTHRWRHRGRTVTEVALTTPIQGGRPTGFRTYTHKTDFPADPAGPWTVDVLTPAGQLIGRVRFQVDP
jgi:hypothetical protein